MDNHFRQRRGETFEKLAGEVFDILIIGGGITGAGIALDASERGLRTALVEKRDFAAGTSSRSTKLIHGGLRYLEHFDFALVREGLRERAILAKVAPHLAQPFPFLIPIYKNSKRNYDNPLKMRAGLFLYDFLASRYRFERHRRLTRDEALRFASQLDPKGLKGAFLYYDAITDDSRLVIENIKAAAERGATIANHAKVRGFLKDGNRVIEGVRLRDEIDGSEIDVRARAVINATGVWMEETIKLSDDAPKLAKIVRPSKGIHLTVSADRLRVNSAWLIPSLTGHRFYFIVPWNGRVNIGTTDTDYHGEKDFPRAEEAEVSEILNAVNSYFPNAGLDSDDVISSWAGLRPLITDSNSKNTADVSRKEDLFETSQGLISISGGKLTTYRLMAERATDLAARRLRENFGIESGAARTDEIPVSGGAMNRQELENAAKRLVETENLSLETARHLLFSYGSNYMKLIDLIRQDESLRESLIEGLPQVRAEVVYAVRHEMAVTLSDALTRRIRLAMLAGKDSLACAPAVAKLMAKELSWNEEEARYQIDDFAREFQMEYEPPTR